MMRLFLLISALALSSCSRSNNLFLGEVQAQAGKHTIRVTDCYRTSVPPPERLPDVDGKPAYRFMPCRDADIHVQGSSLTVNGQDYGSIGETDSILVDHGKVSIGSESGEKQGRQ